MADTNTPESLTPWQRELAVLICAKTPIISIATHEEWRFLEQLRAVRQEVVTRQRCLVEKQLKNLDAKLAAAGPASPPASPEPSGPHHDRKRLQDRLDRLEGDESHPIIRWSSAGLQNLSRESVVSLPPPYNRDKGRNPVEVLDYLRDHPTQRLESAGKLAPLDLPSGIFVFCDVHPWLDREERQARYNHSMVRMLRDLAHFIRRGEEPRTIVLLCPHHCVPPELRMDAHVTDFPLPSQEDIRRRFDALRPAILEKYGDDAVRLNEQELDDLVRSMSGLTQSQADSVIVKSLAEHGYLDGAVVKQAGEEKAQIIRKDGILEVVRTDIKLANDVGGLELLVNWLKLRYRGFRGGRYACGPDGTERKPLPVPKGMLIVGVPGCGKSLVAKATAAAWGHLPLLRLEVGRIFGQYVGESEKNINRAIRIAEVVAPCVLWIDEIEKAFPKTTGSGDSGTSLRVLNVFLTWLQEKTAPVFVVATANDITLMPTEITRKGRFDEIFYVGLPDHRARKAIVKIHAESAGFTLAEAELDDLARDACYFTGAEIEQAVAAAKYLVDAVAATDDRRPFVAAMKRCMARAPDDAGDVPVIVPLAMRTTEDGRPLLQKTHDAAVQIATAASVSFEPLPGEGVRSQRIQDRVFRPGGEVI